MNTAGLIFLPGGENLRVGGGGGVSVILTIRKFFKVKNRLQLKMTFLFFYWVELTFAGRE